jgi:hypothetical protein
MRIRPWTRVSGLVPPGEAAPPAVDARLGDHGARRSRLAGLTRRSLGRGEGGPSPRPGLFPQTQARVIR